MRRSIVPAQITTVEDKIAGNLTLSQLVLLTAPVFISGLIYVVLPPTFTISTLKISLVTIITILFGLMAIRIKSKLLIFWAIIIIRYNLRPRYHVYDKNDMHLRHMNTPSTNPEPEQTLESLNEPERSLPLLSTLELVKMRSIVDNPKANFHIKITKKGAFSVHITEVK